MTKKAILIFFLVCLLNVSDLFSALQLELFKYDNFQNITIDISQYPIFKAKIRVKKDGSYVAIQKDNLVIVEDCWTGRPKNVSSPDGVNWQEITWYTKIRGPFQKAQFMVVYQNESAVITGSDKLESMSQISIFNGQDHYEPDMFFGDLSIGQDSTRGIIINAPMAITIGGQEQPVRVDSVKTHTGNFTYEWRGSSINTQPPPVDFISPFYYRARINFKPDQKKYYRDKFSVYYAGGKVEEINLIGNTYEMKRSTMLNVLYPNGGELFEPCEKVKIKWSGHVRGIPTAIFYSSDSGKSWNSIAETLDSNFIWTVPNVQSSNVLIKVKQNFRNTSERTMKADNVPVRRIAYRSDGFSALAANDLGNIFQWDLTNFEITQKYSIDKENSGDDFVPFGVAFVNNDSMIVAGFYKLNPYNGKRYDSLAYFKTGSEFPEFTLPVGQGFYVKKMYIDSKKEKLALVPNFGNVIKIFSARNGSFIQDLVMPFPVSGFAFNSVKSECAVSLFSGEIQLLSSEDFHLIKTLDFSNLPLVTEIGLSANNEMIALGCQAPTPNIIVGNSNEIHVAEISSGMIFRTIRNTASNVAGLEFSPSSNVLVVGSEAQPQIALWDLPSNAIIGTMAGNDNILTDFKFSPEGHSIITSASSFENFVIRFFTYPEEDSSDNTFRIIAPDLTIQKLGISSRFLATDNNIDTTTMFCNKGIVPLVIEDAKFVNGKHFKLISDFRGDTLKQNECLPLSMIYTPLDTGLITDSLAITTCIGIFYLPIQSYGLKRNISFLQSVIDFGELCVGDTVEKQIDLARNDDPVNLKVNVVTIDDPIKNPFIISKNVINEIIPPGGIIKISVKFIPKELGKLSRKFVISHSDQTKMQEKGNVTGTGIGSLVQMSHSDLRFIPEIPVRKILVKNITQNIITITKFVFSTEGVFESATNLPLTIPIGGESELSVRWNGQKTDDIKLTFDAEPCMLVNNVTLGMFAGNSLVSVEDVSADPKGEATLKVNFKNNSANLYKGIRTFSADLTINPRIFLPLEVSSSIGSAKLRRNEIIGDKRFIGIDIEGDFPESGKLADIKGVAGLAEVDYSEIQIDGKSSFWGSSVSTSIQNGVFRLINLCGDRRILQKSVSITSIDPNPANEGFTVRFNSTETINSIVEVYDNLGILIKKISFEASLGSNELKIDASAINPGSYRVIVREGTDSDTKPIMIIR